MKFPFKVIQISTDKVGWYIADNKETSHWFMGDGKKGKNNADRTFGNWYNMHELGYKKGVKNTKRIPKKHNG